MSRSVLVTGGNRGIGLAVARALADAGDKVAVTYRTGEPPDGLFGVRCDVTDDASVREAVEAVRIQQGAVQVLVSNAGITRDSLLMRMSDDDFAAVLDTNLLGAVRMTRAVLNDMVLARWGRLVYVSSITGLSGAPGQTNYGASKAGLIGFARSVAKEFGRRHITANVVTPGLIRTEMSTAVSEKRWTALVGETVLGRAGEPGEVAAVVRFLCGDDAGYVTGATLPVTGGAGMGQ
ncbi:SDR family oxidoreductase [Kineosporia succinea]|uniref:3-oxoacyl-[acyl-carrier protein] reductase n=1 Tax=Kineosporia succinea TaxID=84632 RepID=A0ABT9P6X8_9ACTN|nr:SDR family oxidoreductase [Kineosporia succinea]MDP9828428.1 3-oxoacyl-[acyl-carrier protein] reductase [Kineosporia succinea]